MAKHLLRGLEKLKREILLVGSLVESATNRALIALNERRVDLADEVIAGDQTVDEREIEVEEDCLEFLALHQPVASDLRYVVTVLKVNNDLERVGDLAGNIAARAKDLIEISPPVEIPTEIRHMGDQVQGMLRKCLDALVQKDTRLAREVIREDEAVDQQHKEVYDLVQARMDRNPERINSEVQLLSVSRYLERIADLATNIAEDVIFAVDGDVVRHRSW